MERTRVHFYSVRPARGARKGYYLLGGSQRFEEGRIVEVIHEVSDLLLLDGSDLFSGDQTFNHVGNAFIVDIGNQEDTALLS